jgi:hypothetical protein
MAARIDFNLQGRSCSIKLEAAKILIAALSIGSEAAVV